jgi:tyrosyl-tRNA synthetase
MTMRWFVATAGAIFLFVTLTEAGRADDAVDKLAKEAVEQILKAYKASDINAIMATVDTPWFHSGKEVIKDREQLKREFHKELSREKDRAGLQHKITDCMAYKTVRDKLKGEEQKLADEVLTEEDRVLLVRIGKDVTGDQGDKVAFLVRIRDGKAKVVGLKD